MICEFAGRYAGTGTVEEVCSDDVSSDCVAGTFCKRHCTEWHQREEWRRTAGSLCA